MSNEPSREPDSAHESNLHDDSRLQRFRKWRELDAFFGQAMPDNDAEFEERYLECVSKLSCALVAAIEQGDFKILSNLTAATREIGLQLEATRERIAMKGSSRPVSIRINGVQFGDIVTAVAPWDCTVTCPGE